MRRLVTRRASLGIGLGLLGAGAWGAMRGQAARADDGPPSPSADDNATPEPRPIVDAHQHLWDLSKFQLPWVKGHPLFDRSFVLDDYREAARGLNIVRSVYMEVDVAPEQQGAEAEYVLDLCARNEPPLAGAVISGRPSSEEFEAHARRFARHKHLKGVRQVLHGGQTPAGYCLQSLFVRNMQLLGELGLSFDLCMRPGELRDADQLVAQCPHTQFVLDHCGNRNVQEQDPQRLAAWSEGLRALAQRPNVVCKISGIVASAPEGWTAADLAPTIDFTLATFGTDRCLFAGDWPVCTRRATLAQWVRAVQEIVRSRPLVDQRQILHDNAVRIYRL